MYCMGMAGNGVNDPTNDRSGRLNWTFGKFGSDGFMRRLVGVQRGGSDYS